MLNNLRADPGSAEVRKRFVVVSGAPGAGKSTIASLLADELSWPLLSKDLIKDALFESLGIGDVEWSKRLGGAAMEVLFALAGELRHGVLASFWRREHALGQLNALGADLVEIYCSCPIEVARSRFAARGSGSRHPGHRDDERLRDQSIWSSDDALKPLGLSAVMVVDTTTPPNIAAIVAAVRSQVCE